MITFSWRRLRWSRRCLCGNFSRALEGAAEAPGQPLPEPTGSWRRWLASSTFRTWPSQTLTPGFGPSAAGNTVFETFGAFTNSLIVVYRSLNPPKNSQTQNLNTRYIWWQSDTGWQAFWRNKWNVVPVYIGWLGSEWSLMITYTRGFTYAPDAEDLWRK